MNFKIPKQVIAKTTVEERHQIGLAMMAMGSGPLYYARMEVTRRRHTWKGYASRNAWWVWSIDEGLDPRRPHWTILTNLPLMDYLMDAGLSAQGLAQRIFEILKPRITNQRKKQSYEPKRK